MLKKLLNLSFSFNLKVKNRGRENDVCEILSHSRYLCQFAFLYFFRYCLFSKLSLTQEDHKHGISEDRTGFLGSLHLKDIPLSLNF